MKSAGLKIGDIEKAFAGRPHGVIGDYSYYSVLVPIVDVAGELNLVFEVRASGLKRQPGEICFPGGMLESGETGEECAVRETVEELGIGRSDVRVIAQLDSIHAYSNFTLYSYLGEISHEKLLGAKISRKEVESFFCVPLSEFVENEPFVYKSEIIPDIGDDFPYGMIDSSDGYDWGKGIHEVPIYRLGGRVIWGLTARITHNLAKILREAAAAN